LKQIEKDKRYREIIEIQRDERDRQGEPYASLQDFRLVFLQFVALNLWRERMKFRVEILGFGCILGNPYLLSPPPSLATTRVALSVPSMTAPRTAALALLLLAVLPLGTRATQATVWRETFNTPVSAHPSSLCTPSNQFDLLAFGTVTIASNGQFNASQCCGGNFSVVRI
jgi:hypothetical protein